MNRTLKSVVFIANIVFAMLIVSMFFFSKKYEQGFSFVAKEIVATNTPDMVAGVVGAAISGL